LSNEAHIPQEELELFALGALPDAEAAEVGSHASGCAACTKGLAEARGHVALLAFSAEQETPSPAVKAKLMSRVAAERVGSEQASGTGYQVAGSQRVPRKAAWWNWVLAPATAILALLSFALWHENGRLFNELREAQRMAASLEQERVHVQKLVNALAAPETITVKLAGTEDAAGASGVVKYNSRTGLVVYMAQLPPLPAEKVYQMWLVPTNGAPISAGIFIPPPDGRPRVLSAEVPGDTEPKAFAVTIEPTGGVAQPTGPKVLLGAS
jgi:anti-sigma-K factor RskA